MGVPSVIPVPLDAKALELLRPHVDPAALGPLVGAKLRARDLLAGRRVWSVNSTAVGGGVAGASWPIAIS